MENYAIKVEDRKGRYSILNSTFPGSGGPVLEIETLGGVRYKAENLDLKGLAGAMSDLYLCEIRKPIPKHQNPDALEPRLGIDFTWDGTDLEHDKGGLAALILMHASFNNLFAQFQHEKLISKLTREKIEEVRRVLQS